jgi:hypothetical protein
MEETHMRKIAIGVGLTALLAGIVFADLDWDYWQTRFMLSSTKMAEMKKILHGLPAEMLPLRMKEQKCRQEICDLLCREKVDKEELNKLVDKLMVSIREQEDLMNEHFLEMRDVLTPGQLKPATSMHPFDLIHPGKVVIPEVEPVTEHGHAHGKKEGQ